MSKSPEDPYMNWLLNIRKDLRAAVYQEAAENKRSAPAQMEIILCERYDIPVLTEDDKNTAREQVKSGKGKVIPPRTRKGAKRRANGTDG